MLRAGPSGIRPKEKHQNIEEEISLAMEMPASVELLKHDDIWVCDTAASNHFVKSNHGAVNVKSNNVKSQGMTGESVNSNQVMDFVMTQYSKSGAQGGRFRITDVSFNPKFNFNLFSAARCLNQGWTMTGCKKDITLISPCGSHKIVFDIVVQTPKGAIYATMLKRQQEFANAEVEAAPRPISLKDAHAKLGHCDIEKTKRTARKLGWDIKDATMPPCASCAAGKAKQRAVPKSSDRDKATRPGERWYHDESTIADKAGAKAPKKQWHAMIDEYSRYSISRFYKHKDEFIETMLRILRDFTDRGYPPKAIRMDNAGENKKFMEVARSNEWNIKAEMECTSRSTPQQNNLVEINFATIGGRARAMCNYAKMPDDVRVKVSNEALSHSTDLGNLVVDKGHTKTRYERMGLPVPKWANKSTMRTFGEAGIVKQGKNGKLGDRGVPMVFVGYPKDHASDCYRMWNPATGKCNEVRDVIWLHRMYYQDNISAETAMLPEIRVEMEELTAAEEAVLASKPNESRQAGGIDPVLDETEVENELASLTEASVKTESSDGAADIKIEAKEGDDDSVVTEVSADSDKSNNQTAGRTRYGREVKAPVQLTAEKLGEWSAAEIRLMQAEQAVHEDDVKAEISLIGATGEGFSHTSELQVMNYKQAMASKDAAAWQMEVDKEHQRMVDNDVWEVVPKSEVPKGTKILNSVWAMKPKADGSKRARMNAKGCSQVAGQHYDADNISSPVTNTSSIRIAFTILVLAKMAGWVVDVNGAFLLGKFKPGDPEIFMNVPEGMTKWYQKYTYPIVLRLKRCLYGTKQAAKYYYDDVVSKMKKMKCERSKADPCLFFKWDNLYGLVMWLTWIDDKLCIASQDIIEREKEELKTHYKCDDVGPVEDYIGCKITIDHEERSVKFTQPVLVQSLNDEFEDIPQGSNPLTPARPGNILTTCVESDKLSPEMHSRYRTGVGKLLYLAKNSRPDIANAVRELARHCHAPSKAHWDAMTLCIRYVRGTPTRGLVLKPSGLWDGKDRNFKFTIRGRSDSNYATDPESRRSVTGTVVYLNDSPIIYGSVTQKHVTLSVTEAELAAAVSLVQDMMYTYRVVVSMGLEVELPMLVEMDNSGARDLANSWSVGGRTRHVDVRMFFLRELKEDGLLAFKHVSGTENESDIFTKNVDAATLHKHAVKFCGEDDLYESLKKS